MTLHGTKKVLDIGCGKQKVPGAIGIDFNVKLDADIAHNLNEFPYPFSDSEFDEIHIRDTLFLLDNPVKVMEEVYRLCKMDGEVVVLSPYFRSVWAHVDPGFRNFCTAHSFAFYDPVDPLCIRYEYSTARFKTLNIIFNEGLSNRLPTRIIVAIANRFPRKYELYLSHLFPLDTINSI